MSSAQLWASSCPVQPTDHNVYASECPECGRLHYPWVLLCKKCGYRRYPEDHAELFWSKKNYKSWKKVPLEGRCKLLTFTRLWALPVGFDEHATLMLGVVEFDNGVRALGQLDVAEPTLGMALNATPGVIKRYPTHEEWGLHFAAP